MVVLLHKLREKRTSKKLIESSLLSISKLNIGAKTNFFTFSQKHPNNWDFTFYTSIALKLDFSERKQSSLVTFSIGNSSSSNNVTFEEELDAHCIKQDTNGCNNDIEEMAADEEENSSHVHLQNGALQNGVDGIVKEVNGNEHVESGERPQRKNGTILFAADGPSGSGVIF